MENRLVSDELAYSAEILKHKVLKIWPGLFLLLIARSNRREIN